MQGYKMICFKITDLNELIEVVHAEAKFNYSGVPYCTGSPVADVFSIAFKAKKKKQIYAKFCLLLSTTFHSRALKATCLKLDYFCARS